MKYIKTVALCAAILLLASCSNRSDVMRLHVIANSDSETDQQIKLKVRDGIYSMLGGELALTENADEANETIANNTSRIKSMAEDIIRENGQEYSAKVIIGEFDFPDKTYAGTVYPKGRYQAVQIILGDGGGENWWCVMFPPLCFVDVSEWEESVVPNPSGAPVEFKSLFAQWYEELFGGRPK
ncbi:MAG: stage II sporulation protein R [Christensenellales bacterium]